MSPISILYTQEKENFLEFIVYTFAIIGGIYTIASIVDSIIHKSMSIMFKSRINKLS